MLIAQTKTVPSDENIFIGLSGLPKESTYVTKKKGISCVGGEGRGGAEGKKEKTGLRR